MPIHATALIDPKAKLDSSVEIGPFAIIGPYVQIDSGTVIGPYASVIGRTTMGKNNRVFQHAVIGGPPQDKKYAGEPTALEIGHGNTFRECVTISTGTVQDKGITRVGNDNWLMAYSHVGHDCQVGNHTVLANSVALAGHVVLGDYVILGGLAAVHQFVRVGAYAMAGGGSIILQDVPPFVLCQGYPAVPRGLNIEGLKRRGLASHTVVQLKQAYKLLYRDGLSFEAAKQAIERLRAGADAESEPYIALLCSHLSEANRGIIR